MTSLILGAVLFILLMLVLRWCYIRGYVKRWHEWKYEQDRAGDDMIGFYDD